MTPNFREQLKREKREAIYAVTHASEFHPSYVKLCWILLKQGQFK